MNRTACNNLLDILNTYNDSIDYLVKRIVLGSSAVLLGSKPASTITFSKQQIIAHNSCLDWWDLHKETIIKNSKLKYYELHRTSRYTLIMVFDIKKMNSFLNQPDIINFLSGLGYRTYFSTEEKLFVLKMKFNYDIPHEIGVFLGIPLKDVEGFMGISKHELSCTMGWKVYGDIYSSAAVFNQYKECKEKVITMLSNNLTAFSILNNYPIG